MYSDKEKISESKLWGLGQCWHLFGSQKSQCKGASGSLQPWPPGWPSAGPAATARSSVWSSPLKRENQAAAGPDWGAGDSYRVPPTVTHHRREGQSQEAWASAPSAPPPFTQPRGMPGTARSTLWTHLGHSSILCKLGEKQREAWRWGVCVRERGGCWLCRGTHAAGEALVCGEFLQLPHQDLDFLCLPKSLWCGAARENHRPQKKGHR